MSDLIIFDGDGTLWNSYDAYLYGLTTILEKEGIKLNAEDITGEMMAKGIAFTLSRFLNETDEIPKKRQEIGDLALDYIATHNKEIICHGAPEILRRAKETNKKFALVTNSSPLVTTWILKNTSLDNSEFEEILPNDKTSKKERIRKLMKDCAVMPEHVEMIDDTIHGMKLAKDLGCEGILVLHEASWQHKTPVEKTPKDIRVVYSLDEITFD